MRIIGIAGSTLLAAVIVAAATATGVATAQNKPTGEPAIGAEIKAIDDSLAWMDRVLASADRGALIMLRSEVQMISDLGYLFAPVNREDFAAAVHLSVISGEMTADEATRVIAHVAAVSQRAVAQLRLTRTRLAQQRAEIERQLAAPPGAARPRLQPWELGRPPAGGPPPEVREETQAKAGGCDGFVGTWNTNYGPMWIGGSDGAINGSYEWNSAYGPRTDTLSGSVSGNVATGTYTQPGYPEPAWASGRFTFTLSSDGESWSGQGFTADGSASMGWNGTCAGGPNERTDTDAPKN